MLHFLEPLKPNSSLERSEVTGNLMIYRTIICNVNHITKEFVNSHHISFLRTISYMWHSCMRSILEAEPNSAMVCGATMSTLTFGWFWSWLLEEWKLQMVYVGCEVVLLYQSELRKKTRTKEQLFTFVSFGGSLSLS